VTEKIAPELLSGLGTALTGNLGASIAKWTFYIFLMTAIFGGIYLIYLYLFEYKYKVTYFERTGIGLKGDGHSIGKIRKDRIKPIKKNGQITSFKLFWQRKNIEPLDMAHIMPNNNIFLYKTGIDTFIPVEFKCGNPQASLGTINMDIKKWAMLELAQIAQEYQKHDFWTDNKQFFMTVITVIACCAFAGFVIWLAFQKTDSVVPVLERLSEGVKNVNVIPSAPN